MSTTTVNLGYVPKNRGEYSSTASYYKDNIVQYNGSSYICNPPNYDPDTAPTASITGVAPYASDPAVPNTGWAVFCNDSSGVGEGVYDVSVDHTTDSQPKKYADLSAALQDVPQAKQKGGMTIRFIQSSDNKYVQFRLMKNTWSATESDWQGVDDEPTAGSNNLVKSGGVADTIGFVSESEYNGSSAWFFNNFSAKANYPYYIKLISGYGNTIRLLVGSSYADNALKTGEWVKITFPTNGHPYIYVGSVTVTQPVIKVISADSEIALLEQSIENCKTDIDALESDFESTIHSKTAVGVNKGTSWMFDGVTLVSGVAYQIKLVSGFGNGYSLAIGSSSGTTPLVKGAWVEYTAPSTGTPYLYFGSTSAGEQPIIQIAGQDNIIVHHDDKITKNTTRIEELEDEVNVTLSESEYNGNSAWVFNDITFNSGKTYYVKLISGYGNTVRLVVGSTSVDNSLKTGEWVFVTSPATGHPYLYVGSVTVTQPVIEVASADSIIVPLDKRVQKLEDGADYHVINVSYDGTSKVGRTIHYSGLTAIADALNSITDASPTNRYIIHVEGEFHFTDPLTVPMLGGGEYSVILMKNYVDIEGDGPDKSIVFVDFPANATFHEGKHYDDYQPIYFFGVGGNIRNMKIMGKNCRYAFHIESSGADVTQKPINIENCVVESYGAPDYNSYGQMTCLGTGMNPGQTWNIRNTNLYNWVDGGDAFATHTPLFLASSASYVNFKNCMFFGSISLHNYQQENNTFVNFDGCRFLSTPRGLVRYLYYNNRTHAKHGDYTTILTKGDISFLYINDSSNSIKGGVLCVKAISTGNISVVRFNETSSAFNVIVGDSSFSGKEKTIYGWDSQYGFVYRDGGVGLSGQAFGTQDIDENATTGRSLASLLGDCSSTNKSLGITIDGVDYTIVFNEDYTDKDNSYVLDKINSVIGSVATASVFCPAKLYYPMVNGLCDVKCVDENSIMKGMGVIFAQGGMLRAKAIDGYIDGICLDDCANGQFGRVITKGYISASFADAWFKTLDDLSSSPTPNSQLGLSTTIDGKFELNKTPSLLRWRGCLEILNK